jgi:hypothetical protein
MAIINSLIPILPLVTYVIILLSYKYTSEPSLLPFFIEWSISIPLLLINIGKLIQLSTRQYTIIFILPIGMTLTGYSAVYTDAINMTILLCSISVILYILTIGVMFVNYRRYTLKKHRDTNFPSQLHQNNIIVFRTLFYVIAVTWNGYPVIFFLWKSKIIMIEHAIMSFACMDIVTKGITVLVLLAHTLLLHKKNGFIVNTFKKIIKVHPITETLPTFTDSTLNTASNTITNTTVTASSTLTTATIASTDHYTPVQYNMSSPIFLTIP